MNRRYVRKPDWLKVYMSTDRGFHKVYKLINNLGLNTICRSARCPNIYECWSSKTATFMILGDTCTRNCRFCNVKKGNPHGYIDREEVDKLLRAIEILDLNYVVITSVDRDDLADGGASQYSRTIRAIRNKFPNVIIEVLTPDFLGDEDSIKMVLNAGPHVFAHNIETVRRLTPLVRDRRASYEQSLSILRYAKEYSPKVITKSSILLGFGERADEVIEAMTDLRDAGVDILTIGQYLQPSPKHYQVREFITPDRFEYYESMGYELGFRLVVSGPLVRSSYRAAEYYLGNAINHD